VKSHACILAAQSSQLERLLSSLPIANKQKRKAFEVDDSESKRSPLSAAAGDDESLRFDSFAYSVSASPFLPVVDITDLPPRILSLLVRFMYGGIAFLERLRLCTEDGRPIEPHDVFQPGGDELEFVSTSNVIALMFAAQNYLDTPKLLQTFCADLLASSLSTANVLDVFGVARIVQNEYLVLTVSRYVLTNFAAVTSSAHFKRLQRQRKDDFLVEVLRLIAYDAQTTVEP